MQEIQMCKVIQACYPSVSLGIERQVEMIDCIQIVCHVLINPTANVLHSGVGGAVDG